MKPVVLILAILLSFLFFSCEEKVDYGTSPVDPFTLTQPNDYLPLRVGNTWVYEVLSVEGFFSDHTIDTLKVIWTIYSHESDVYSLAFNCKEVVTYNNRDIPQIINYFKISKVDSSHVVIDRNFILHRFVNSFTRFYTATDPEVISLNYRNYDQSEDFEMKLNVGMRYYCAHNELSNTRPYYFFEAKLISYTPGE